MRITYLGQCGFLLEDGDLRIVTDPYLSDSVDRNHYSKETPWKRLYPAPITLGELKPDIVFISHEHNDFMDLDTICPYCAAGGEAPIVIYLRPKYTRLTSGDSKSFIRQEQRKALNQACRYYTDSLCAYATT